MHQRTPQTLVVDGESHISHTLRFLIERHRHQVTVASDGEEALRVILDGTPDAVFLDLNLPGKHGLEFCEEGRSDIRFANLPIHSLTSKGKDTDVERGVGVGATDYTTKPFAPSGLKHDPRRVHGEAISV